MADTLLTLNAGSSSVKFAVFEADGPLPVARYRGAVDTIGGHGRFSVHDASGAAHLDQAVTATDHRHALALILGWLEQRADTATPACVGHRVVHGGHRFVRPVVIDADVCAQLRQLIPLAPLHQTHNLAAIEALANLKPELVQVACFDTAFHHSIPAEARRFALPRELEAEGIQCYGFHGLSYEYIASNRRTTSDRPPMGGSSPPTWATAPACAPCAPGAASPPA